MPLLLIALYLILAIGSEVAQQRATKRRVDEATRELRAAITRHFGEGEAVVPCDPPAGTGRELVP